MIHSLQEPRDANSLPASIASMSASVSLLRMQSMSCRCERSPALSSLRRPGILPPMLDTPDLGSASRPSKRSTRMRSTRRIVSRMLRSSPPSALSMESGRSERRRSCVIDVEPRHKVDSRLTTVEMVAADLLSAPATTRGDQSLCTVHHFTRSTSSLQLTLCDGSHASGCAAERRSRKWSARCVEALEEVVDEAVGGERGRVNRLAGEAISKRRETAQRSVSDLPFTK